MNVRHSLVRPRTQPNFPTAPQTKNGNHFFLPTSQKIDTFHKLFLIKAFVHLSVCGFVRQSVGLSIHHAFLKNREFTKIQGNSSKFNKIHDFSQLLAGQRPCFLGDLLSDTKWLYPSFRIAEMRFSSNDYPLDFTVKGKL